jgi:hypothetical protein
MALPEVGAVLTENLAIALENLSDMNAYVVQVPWQAVQSEATRVGVQTECSWLVTEPSTSGSIDREDKHESNKQLQQVIPSVCICLSISVLLLIPPSLIKGMYTVETMFNTCTVAQLS